MTSVGVFQPIDLRSDYQEPQNRVILFVFSIYVPDTLLGAGGTE